MSSKPEDINTQNSEMFKLLGEVSKQNSESITKLGEGQEGIVKTLDNINETLKNVTASDNNNPTGPGIGMEQKPKVESPGDVGDKTKAPNAYAPGEYGSTGRGDAEPGKDKGGLSMEAKKEFELKLKAEEEEAKEKKEYDDYKEKKKADEEEKTKLETEEKKKADEEEAKTKLEAEEKKKADEKEKENKYKSFDYTNNEPLRPAVMTKQFESYPNGYQIMKAALEQGWGIDGIDAEGSYVETLKRLDNHEFGTFGHNDTGGSYY